MRHIGATTLLVLVTGGLVMAGPARPEGAGTVLTVAWEQGEQTRRLTVLADGGVLLNEVRVGGQREACIVSEGARTEEWSVCLEPRSRVVGGELCSGRFVARPRLRGVDGRTPRVGEVLIPDQGDGMAIASDGEIWMMPPDRRAFPLPGHATGVSPKNRRLALALLCLGPRLVAKLEK